MKSAFMVSVLLFSASASAAPNFDVTLSRTFTRGTPDAADFQSLQCNIYLTPAYFVLEQKLRLGIVESSRSSDLRIQNISRLLGWVEASKQGPIAAHPGIAGADTISYVATQRTSPATDYIDLFITGQLELRNSAPEARLLIQFLDLNCPKLD